MVHGRARESAFPRPLRVAAAFAVAAAAAFVPAGAGAAPSPPSPAAVPPTAAAVQDEPLSCKDCHEEVQEASLASIHGKVVAEPALDSCEMCHVGKERHLKVVGGDAKGPRPPLSGFAKPVDCLPCHATIPARHEKEMPAWRGMKNAACTACHVAHAPAAEVKRLRGLGPFADAEGLAKAGGKPAGMPACAKCHEGPIREFKASSHAKALQEKGAGSCEACHGPASLHAASGGVGRLVLGFRRLDTAGQARFCLACHDKEAPDHAKEFAASKHSEGGKTCASCHRVHAAAAPAPGDGFARLADARKGAAPVGSARCAECHADPHPGLAKSRHAPVMGADRAGCEGCHGNGSAHAASAGRKSLVLHPTRLEPADRDGICLSCHERTSSPASWARHPHGGAGIACLSCHDPFGPPGTPARQPEPALCAKCHGLVTSRFQLPNRHPVEEGALRCSDCHDLHRAAPAVFAGKRWTDTCAKCHRTEASPRLHPHEADRADGCIACHEPHGTTAPRMLRFSRTLDLCLSCHIPPATHDLTPGSAYASCLACHTEIHGSDADRKLLR